MGVSFKDRVLQGVRRTTLRVLRSFFVCKALSEREQALAQDLAAEEQELSRSAEDAIKQMEENYSSKKEQTIQKIIERVISEYGSQ